MYFIYMSRDPLDDISLEQLNELERIQRNDLPSQVRPSSIHDERRNAIRQRRMESVLPFVEAIPQPLFSEVQDELGNEQFVEREITLDEQIMEIIDIIYHEYSNKIIEKLKPIYIQTRSRVNDEQKQKILRGFKILLASYINFRKEYSGEGHRFNETLDKLNDAKSNLYWTLEDPYNEREHEYKYIDDDYMHSNPMELEEGGKLIKRRQITKKHRIKKQKRTIRTIIKRTRRIKKNKKSKQINKKINEKK